MDDTDQSRASDAAATRKRRSSILKSQRPARTPFSELEFNVATPTDTAKSRRVSFSKRTGVAEFVTNEATTTWKNFYEEHNKSLESSGNDSEVKSSRQSVGHLGKRIFDQQFEEVEAIDFITSLNPPTHNNVSLTNINFMEKMVSLDRTSDEKLTAPQRNYELSTLTDGSGQSKLFGNDFTVTGIGEMSGRIAVNFSAIQQINEGDDLDEIERDLERFSNVVCPGPKVYNVSEYIEVDLNMTHVAKTDECNMSITDIIPMPKLKDIHKISAVDRENVMIKNNDDNADISITRSLATNILTTVKSQENNQTVFYEDTISNVSVTKAVPTNLIIAQPSKVTERRGTVVYDDYTGNISVTQALPPNIILGQVAGEKTQLFDAADISMTQIMPTNILVPDQEKNKRKTILYEEEAADISITQAIPCQYILGVDSKRETTDEIISANPDSNKHKTIIYDSESANISMTQIIPTHILLKGDETIKSETVLREKVAKDISTTQKVSCHSNKRNTIIYDNDSADISMTQVVPTSILLKGDETNKKSTMRYEEPAADISITQAIPGQCILGADSTCENSNDVISTKPNSNKRKTIIYDSGSANISMTQTVPANILLKSDEIYKKKTMLCGEETGNITVTQTISNELITGLESTKMETSEAFYMKTSSNKYKTIIYDSESDDISVTQIIPTNILLKPGEKNIRRSMLSKVKNQNIPITQTVHYLSSDSDPNNMNPNSNLAPGDVSNKRESIIYDDKFADLITTESAPTSVINNEKIKYKNATVCEEKDAIISVTQAVVCQLYSGLDPKNKESNEDISVKSSSYKREPVFYEEPTAISMIQSISTNSALKDIKRNTSKNTFNEEAANSNFMEHAVPPTFIPECNYNDMPSKDELAIKPSSKTSVYNSESVDTAIKQIRSTTLKNEEETHMSSKRYEDIELISVSDPRNVRPDDQSVKISSNTLKASIHDNYSADISKKQIIPSKNLTVENDADRKKRPYEDDLCNISLTEKDPWKKANEFLLNGVASNFDYKVQTIGDMEEITEKLINSVEFNIQDDATDAGSGMKFSVYKDYDDAEMSITEDKLKLQKITKEESKTVSNLYVTKPIPHNLITMSQHDNMVSNITINKKLDLSQQVNYNGKDLILYQAVAALGEQELESDEQRELKSDINDIDSQIATSIEIYMDAPSVKDNNSRMTHNKTKSEDLDIKANNIHGMDVDQNLLHFIEKAKPPVKYFESLPSKASQLNKFLNMSISSSPQNTKKQNLIFIQPKQLSQEVVELSSENISSTIMEEDDTEVQTDEIGKEVQILANEMSHSVKAISSNIEDQELGDLMSLHNKLANVSTALKYIECSNEVCTETKENTVKEEDDKNSNKSFRNPNDTKALLDLISNITDESRSEYECVSPPITTRSVMAIEQRESFEPKRLSIAPSRLSVAINREDLLNSISMAHAVLQNTKFELDESSQIEDTLDLASKNIPSIPKKSIRVSEVVKTLHFEDEFTTETSIKNTPLKKAVFSGKSCVREPMAIRENSKANVIPTYDITDGIKELMSDLVKPMADVLPYKTNHKFKGTACTESKELQADLSTSSQIDMDIDEFSNTPSQREVRTSFELQRGKSYCLPGTNHSFNVAESTRKSMKETIMVPKIQPVQSSEPSKGMSSKEPSFNQVLVFDHQNPLNNVLLRPASYEYAHKYDPIKVNLPQLKSDETLCSSTYSQSCQIDSDNIENDCESNVNVCMNFETQISHVLQVDSIKSDSIDNQSVPELNKPASRDCSVDVYLVDVKDSEVNTVIAMKHNKELLAGSSSLTLVDGLTNAESVTTLSECYVEKTGIVSPVKVKIAGKDHDTSPIAVILQSDTSPNDDVNKLSSRGKKRIHKPRTPIKNSPVSLDITPKPNMKMQKLSTSPAISVKVTPKKDVIMRTKSVGDSYECAKGKETTKILSNHTNSSITVQQLITEYKISESNSESIVSNQILKALQSPKSESLDLGLAFQADLLECNSLGDISFTSSNNLNIGREQCLSSAASSMNSFTQSVPSSRIDWQSDLCSSDQPSDCSSGVNIVAKIDMLPFMGSPDCEWDSSPADTWCFRLLHGRIRLVVRLEHRHDNATRTRVRADTPITDISVETVRQDKKNPVATLCVRFACETVRYLSSHGGAARDVPALLRRAAAVSRTALRWGRALHDARLHLAYALGTDGHLLLKVANIHLRSVWEVSMDLELVVEDATETPWPRASNVRVKRVVSDVPISDDDVQQALSSTPKDWGHVPRTLWRIFRYLKHKTRDDDLLLGA